MKLLPGLQAVMMASGGWDELLLLPDYGCRQSFECRKNSWRLPNAG